MVSGFVNVVVFVVTAEVVVDWWFVSTFVCTPPPDIQSFDLDGMYRSSSIMEKVDDDVDDDDDAIAGVSGCSWSSSS